MKKKVAIISGLLIVIATLVILAFRFKKNDSIIEFNIKRNNEETILYLKTKENYKIYYTVDGTIPTRKSSQYKNEIIINKETSPNTLTKKENSNKIYGKEILYDETLPKGVVIRAIAISSNGSKSEVYTKTFFPDIELNNYFGETTVVSIVMEPNDLLDYKTGIMVKGELYDKWLKKNNKIIKKEEELVSTEFVEGNFMVHGKQWEREGNIEIFEGSNNPIINEKAGFRIKGNISRMYNQKSLNIYFRDKYQNEYINYPLWKTSVNQNNKIIEKYSSITLRNGGNDTEVLKFKDSWLQNLVRDKEVDIQNSKPAVLFINGEYWGVYNLQEKYSEDYYAEHYGLDKNNIIAIKEDELDIGEKEDYQKYEELLSYAYKDLTDDKIYNKFLELIDLQSMLDYYAIETYINNSDWGIDNTGVNKNVLLWRTRSKENNKYGDTKWRWSLYDLEFSSSLYNISETSADYCAIKNAIKKHPLFANAMKNENFQRQFYETYYNLRKTNFEINNIKNSLQNEFVLWEPLMNDHYKRFGNTNSQRFISRNSIIKYFEKKIYSNPC